MNLHLPATTMSAVSLALTIGSSEAAVITYTNDTVVSSALEGKNAVGSFEITANGKLTITDVLIDKATFITGDKDDQVSGLSITNDKCDGKTLNANDKCTFDVTATTADSVKALPNDFGQWLGVPVVFWNDGGAKDQFLGAKDRIFVLDPGVAVPAPEPGTLAVFGIGLAALGLTLALGKRQRLDTMNT